MLIIGILLNWQAWDYVTQMNLYRESQQAEREALTEEETGTPGASSLAEGTTSYGAINPDPTVPSAPLATSSETTMVRQPSPYTLPGFNFFWLPVSPAPAPHVPPSYLRSAGTRLGLSSIPRGSRRNDWGWVLEEEGIGFGSDILACTMCPVLCQCCQVLFIILFIMPTVIFILANVAYNINVYDTTY